PRARRSARGRAPPPAARRAPPRRLGARRGSPAKPRGSDASRRIIHSFEMRLSISAKIFVGFLVVLAVFFAVSVYNLFTMRRLGDELKLVSRGYLDLRLGISEMQTGQSKLLQVMDEQQGRTDGLRHVPRIVKSAIDFERRNRLKTQIPRAIDDVGRLEALRSSKEEHALL